MRVPVLILAGIAGAALLAPWLAPFDPAAQLEIVQLRNQAPSWTHPLGTDAYSRDLLSRVLFGARTSLLVAGLSAAVALSIGIVWGAVAAAFQGRVGQMLMSVADVLRSIPRILLFLGAIVVAGRLDATGLAIALGVASWPATSRIVHVVMQGLLAQPFTEAARALGVPPVRLVIRHVTPHLAGPLGALGALLVADMLALEAGFSFLGLGVRAPVPSWGNMLQDALPYVRSAWWVAAVPCALLVTTVVAVARIADGLAEIGTSGAPDFRQRPTVPPGRSARLFRGVPPAAAGTPAHQREAGLRAS